MNYPSIFIDERGNCKFIPVLQFSSSVLASLIISHGKTLAAQLEKLRIAMKQETRYCWDNTHWQLTNMYGDIFQIYLTESSIKVWDEHEAMVFSGDITEDQTQIRRMVKELEESLSWKSKGFVRCSHCSVWSEYDLIRKNRYFGGIYCNSCWESTFKAMEAKETYD